MILLALLCAVIAAILVAEATVGHDDDNGFGTVVTCAILVFFIGVGMVWDVGAKAANSDWAAGKIVIEKTPVVTTIVE